MAVLAHGSGRTVSASSGVVMSVAASNSSKRDSEVSTARCVDESGCHSTCTTDRGHERSLRREARIRAHCGTRCEGALSVE